jgi:hypothetical protein
MASNERGAGREPFADVFAPSVGVGFSVAASMAPPEHICTIDYKVNESSGTKRLLSATKEDP